MRIILNPRRSPRVTARLRVQVQHASGEWQAETEDIGPGGCLLASPRPLDPGAWVRLTVDGGRLPERLTVAGRVAWASKVEPHRAGVAFVPMQGQGDQDPLAWFERLVQATPGMVPLLRHVPERLGLETPLFVLAPPRFIVDFTPEELALVARVRNGMTVEELLDRGEREKRNEGRMIFALLARRALTLSARDAGDPAAWRPLLEQAGIPVEQGPEGDEPEEVVPLEALSLEPEAVPLEALSLEPEAVPLEALSLEPEPVPPDVSPPAPPGPGGSEPGGAAAEPPKPAGRPASRKPEAQQVFERALAAVEGGDIHGGIALLRQALTLSPRDPEIAAAIGALAFKDRKVPEE